MIPTSMPTTMPTTKRDTAAVRADIKLVIAAAGTLQTRIHELALECLEHAMVHGDCTLIALLIAEMPKGQRVKTLKSWVEIYSPVRWGGGGKIGLVKVQDGKEVVFRLEDAARDPYYNTEEKNPTALTLEAIINIVKRLPNRIDKAEDKGQIAEGEDVNAMREYVNQLQSITVPTNVVSLEAAPTAEDNTEVSNLETEGTTEAQANTQTNTETENAVA